MNKLTFDHFSQINKARCTMGFKQELSDWSLSDWFTATMGELGEAANVAKKLNRARDGIPGNTLSEEELRVELRKEIADVFIYLDLLAQSEGIDLAEAVVSKFNETSEKINCAIKIGPERSQEEIDATIENMLSTPVKGTSP